MELLKLIEHTAEGLGYELFDFETSPRGRLMRVFIDSPNGITVDDCATVSNQLTRIFEVENVEYDRLEVSSPGLDRPLRKPADFERFAGQEVQVRIRMPIANQRNFAGVLQGLKDDVVTLETEKGSMEIPFEEIEKARLVPRF
jgi:ribosome maturation factor RimP